ncbi:MAG TPA: phasin family protein [Syntrophobacteria bacterium]|nr:phasin family protein [Syntrophobacteria bacterium]
MLDTIRKSLLATLGAAVVTKEKVEEATRGWVDEGKISRAEAERLAQDLVESGQHQWGEIQTRVAEMVRKGLDTLDIGSKKEFRELKARVEELERRLTQL